MSDGVHDDGAGEQDDVRAAVDYLTSKTGGNASQVDFVGYSFGAWVGLRALTGDERVHRLVAVAPPVAFLEMSDAGQSGKPKLIVHGTRDEFAPADVLSSWIGSLPEPRQIVALEGADHFFFGFKDRVANEVTDYLRPLG